MGVTKTTHKEGSGAQPAAGQTVTIEYTGFLKDTSKPDNKGKQYVHATPRPAAICLIAGRALMPLPTTGSTAPLAAVTSSLRSALARSSRVIILPQGCWLTHLGATLTTFATGWDEGVTQMKVGEKATLDITA